MITSNFDLYKAEWLELVFDKRNKDYGAYELRQHYGDRMAKAMAITFGAIITLVVGLNFAFKHQPKPIEVMRTVTLTDVHPPKPVEQVKPAAPKAPETIKPATPIHTIKFVTPKPVPDAEAEKTNPPTHDELNKAAVGNTDIKGKDGDGGPAIDTKGGDGPALVENNNIIPFGAVEVNPEPFGGMEAFNKFLSRNLRYPDGSEAQGKVILTFVVEKDGSITAIQVLRSIAPELDAEAIRVLKKAPKWKPGIQNGQPVRVQYTIPFNFTRADEN